MIEKPVPAVGELVAADRIKRPAGAAVTVRLAVVERAFAVSDAVSVCAPDRVRVAEKLPCPFVRLETGGKTTPIPVSLLLKWTVPL